MARRSKGQGEILSGSPSGQFTNFSPKVIQANRAPTTADIGYEIGQLWADTNGTTMYGLSNVSAGSATWNLLGPGASDVDTLTGDAGGAISPAGGNITLAGGTNIGTTGAGSTITFNLDNAISLATSVTSPIYTTSAAAMNINSAVGQDINIQMGDAAGANKVSFRDSAAVEVFSINSNGGLSTLNGLTNTGTFTTSGGAASVNASSNFNTVINSGTSTGTVTIGNGAAGAISVDTGAGISLDGATASNFTVTGAAQDLTLSSSGGSVNITATEAAADAIVIHASDAAGGVQVRGGTGGILIGTDADTTPIGIGDVAPTASRTITVGGGTVVTAAVTDTIDIGPDGATTNANSIKTVNVNSGGVTTGQVLTNIATGAITSGTHTVSIQSGNAAAGTIATNISTGTGTKTVNIGNADANTTVNIDAITLINDSINANTSINTGTSTGTVTIGVLANTGAISVATSSTLDLDSAGQLQINSSGSTIDIGNDAVAQNMNIGTGAAARTITIGNATGATSVVVNSGTGAASFGANATAHTTTIGSTTGASSTVIQAGTGNITVTGTVNEIDAKFLAATGDDITFQQSPLTCTAANTGGVATGATGDLNLISLQNGIIMEQFVLGAGQTIIKPVMTASGLLVSGDLTATEGFEYNFGAARTNSRHAFTIGTSAAFFFEMQMTVADVSGASPYMIGFRKSEANNATLTSYTDYAMIGLDAIAAVGTVVLKTELNSGGTTNTNTTDAWADGQTHTVRINVSAAGVVTYLIDGLAPTVTAAFTFDNADVVVPFFRLEHAAVAPGTVNWNTIKIGFQ